MDKANPYLALAKAYRLLTRAETLLANTNLSALTEFERNRHLEALHDVRGTIAQLQRNKPDLDLDILATELTYWDPELEKRYPDITDWSVMP